MCSWSIGLGLSDKEMSKSLFPSLWRGWVGVWTGSSAGRERYAQAVHQRLLHQPCGSLLIHFPRPLLPPWSAFLTWALLSPGSLGPTWWAHEQQQKAEPELWLSVQPWAQAQGLGKEKWFLVGMNSLAHEAVAARSEILRRLEQDLGFVPAHVPSSKSSSFLCLDFKLCWSALRAEGSNTAHSRLWLLERFCAPGQVPAGNFIWKWSGLLNPVPFCVWAHWARVHGRTAFAGRSYPHQEWDPGWAWGLGPQLTKHRSQLQSCRPAVRAVPPGHAAGSCSLPLPSAPVRLDSLHLRASPLPTSLAQPENRLSAMKQSRKPPQWFKNVLLCNLLCSLTLFCRNPTNQRLPETLLVGGAYCSTQMLLSRNFKVTGL